MIDFILDKWLAIAIAYGIIYATYVVYALFALRFERQAQGRRVTDQDFYEVLGETYLDWHFFAPRWRMTHSKLFT